MVKEILAAISQGKKFFNNSACSTGWRRAGFGIGAVFDVKGFRQGGGHLQPGSHAGALPVSARR